MICSICKINETAPDGTICQICRDSAPIGKVSLVLEGSEFYEFGIVKDCHGSINSIPESAEVVGMWSRYGEGTYWVSLTTPVQALQDVLITLIKGTDEDRKKQQPATRRKTGTPRTVKPPESKPAESTIFNELRNLLKGTKL